MNLEKKERSALNWKERKRSVCISSQPNDLFLNSFLLNNFTISEGAAGFNCDLDLENKGYEPCSSDGKVE
jgi:hypothetical protein